VGIRNRISKTGYMSAYHNGTFRIRVPWVCDTALPLPSVLFAHLTCAANVYKKHVKKTSP